MSSDDDATIQPAGLDPQQIREQFVQMRRLLMVYEHALQTVLLKVNLLRDEFRLERDYNPIEHVSSRVKSPQSITDKARRKGVAVTTESLRANILDIAGLRLICSFQNDIFQVRERLLTHGDLRLREERDYISNPKPNGYQSLHLLVEVPVYLAGGRQWVPVEIQLRTVAMDFWASLEHKIHYKYRGEVPPDLTSSLKLAADMASTMDRTMERLYEEVRSLQPPSEPTEADPMLPLFRAIESASMLEQFTRRDEDE